MKKSILFLFLTSLSFGAYAQYHRMAKQGRVWYSQHNSGGAFIQTNVYAVEGDTVLTGQTYPLLVEKDSSLNTTATLAYLDEDTVAGTLAIRFFAGNGNDQHYDFGLNKGDTLNYNGLRGGQPDVAVVDSVYTILDFNGITRRVLEFGPANPNSQCSNPNFAVAFRPWIEGIGALGLLTEALPECVNGIPFFNLKCVFNGPAKIYGDTVTACYRQTISTKEFNLAKVELYPNPVKKKLNILSELPVAKANLFSPNGTLIREFTEVPEIIDVSALTPGIYILELTDADDNVGRHKVVKE